MQRTDRRMGRHEKVHILTAYLEYLYDNGIKSENYYVGDASRFVRFLLASCGPDQFAAFLARTGSPSYRLRLVKTVRKFYAFAADRLDIENDPTLGSDLDLTPIDNGNRDKL